MWKFGAQNEENSVKIWYNTTNKQRERPRGRSWKKRRRDFRAKQEMAGMGAFPADAADGDCSTWST
jgi:hypothetical protein